MIVLDASVVLEVLLATQVGKEITSLIFTGEETLHAPHLVDLEVAQVLRRYHADGDLSSDRGGVALQDLGVFPLKRYPHDLFLGRIWEMRDSVTAYDAAYIALAEALPARLFTRDRKLANASGHRAEVELV
jgi:predicted nucleic acid-binding protein